MGRTPKGSHSPRGVLESRHLLDTPRVLLAPCCRMTPLGVHPHWGFANLLLTALSSKKDKRATTNVQSGLVFSFFSLLFSFRLFELKQ